MIHMKNKSILACLLAIVMMLLCSYALADTATVTADSLYLREKATSDSSALLLLRKGTRLEVLGKSGSWYKVSYSSYTGYVYDDYVDVSDDDTLQKGDKNSAVKKVQERLKELGYYKNTCDGSYGYNTEKAVKAFQKKNGLTQSGVVDETTLKKLNSSSAVSSSGKAVTVTEEKKEETKDDGTLKKGSKGSEVKKVQERLKELGYYKNSIDGDYGSSTVSAVKAFQKKNGLTQDGVCGEATLKKLNSSSAIASNGKKLSDSEKKEETKDDDTLKKGSKGSEVKKVQERLKELGYYKKSIDGDYGSSTVSAVKAFQKKNGLTQDGVCGEATLKKLNSSSAIASNGKKLSDNEKKEEEKDDGTLKQGSKGSEVKKVQERLKELGYYTKGIDGDYGSSTVSAVKAFQKKNGLTADGVCGSATLKKLNSDDAVNAKGTSGVELNKNQTLKKGDSGEQVKALQKQLKALGYYTTSIDSDYGYRTAEAVSDFQRANKLTVNGIANSTTIKKMLSSSAVTKAQADKAEKEEEEDETYKTERLDWFNGGKSKFSGRPIIEIKDVRTGLVFKGKVLYGSNHLDVEPLTKADTAILLKINGGVDFSWRRRPMLVKHNGHVYAASIYSEPHGEQTILDNNFDGQFCLHFYGSKTHGTGEVKQDHQDAIAEAMKATW